MGPTQIKFVDVATSLRENDGSPYSTKRASRREGLGGERYLRLRLTMVSIAFVSHLSCRSFTRRITCLVILPFRMFDVIVCETPAKRAGRKEIGNAATAAWLILRLMGPREIVEFGKDRSERPADNGIATVRAAGSPSLHEQRAHECDRRIV